MNKPNLYLRDKDKQRFLKLLTELLPTVTAWAYGSRVKGEAHDTSDLDVVLRSTDLTPIPFEELDTFLQALNDSNIPILVEARDWARLPTSFHEEILKNYIVIE